MQTAHLIVGVAVLATNLVAGTVGGIAWLQRRPSVWFWYVLRVAQATVVVQVLLGTLLLLAGNESPDGLHYLYGVLPLLVSLLAEAARAGAAERELTGLDFDSLPADSPAAVRARDRPSRDRDHGRLGAGRLRPRPARRRDQRKAALAPRRPAHSSSRRS